MTPRDTLLKMARHIRKHGFSPKLADEDGCGCFVSASIACGEMSAESFSTMERLHDVVGTAGWFGVDGLIAAGWTEGCTDDAVAACEIAADLATPSPEDAP